MRHMYGPRNPDREDVKGRQRLAGLERGDGLLQQCSDKAHIRRSHIWRDLTVAPRNQSFVSQS